MTPSRKSPTKKSLLFCLVLCFIGFPVCSQEWTLHYQEGYPDGRTHFHDGWVDREGVAFLAGEEGPDYRHPHTLLLRIAPDGTHRAFHYTRPGCHTKATCLVETPDGHLFAVGNCYGTEHDSLLLLLFDKELNLLVERTYGKDPSLGPFGDCKALCDPHGHLIVCTSVTQDNGFGGTEDRGVFFRFDAQGALLHQHELTADFPDPLFYLMDFHPRQLWYRPENETLLVLAPASGGVPSFITFDTAFNYLEEHPIWREEDDMSDHTLFRDAYTDYWYSDDEALFFSSRGDADHNKLRISRINTQGEYQAFIRLHERPDTIDDAARHRCMAAANDSTFYFGFHTHTTGYYPGIAGVYRINGRLEITGRHLDDDHDRYRSWMVLPTHDGGCLTVNDSCAWSGTADLGHPVIHKLRPEDFESVPWTVVSTDNGTYPLGGPPPKHAYPNPAETLLYLPLTGQPTRCQVFDSQGRIVCDRHIDGSGDALQLNVSGLRPGWYLYRLFEDGHLLLQEKFLKQ